MKTWKELTVPIYEFTLVLASGNAKKVHKRILRDGYTLSRGDEDDLLGNNEAVAITLLYKGRPDGFLIWHPTKAKTNEDLAEIAHESVHVATGIFELIGASPTTHENDEPFCYLVEFVAYEALEFYR